MIEGFYFFDWKDLTEEQTADIIEFMTSGGKQRLQSDRKFINMQKMSNFLRRNPDLSQYFVG
jgi:hypothetical protein